MCLSLTKLLGFTFEVQVKHLQSSLKEGQLCQSMLVSTHKKKILKSDLDVTPCSHELQDKKEMKKNISHLLKIKTQV